jgi:hypothetical protein
MDAHRMNVAVLAVRQLQEKWPELIAGGIFGILGIIVGVIFWMDRSGFDGSEQPRAIFSVSHRTGGWRRRSDVSQEIQERGDNTAAHRAPAIITAEKTLPLPIGCRKGLSALSHKRQEPEKRRAGTLGARYFRRIPRNSFGPAISRRFRLARSSPVAVLSITRSISREASSTDVGDKRRLRLVSVASS